MKEFLSLLSKILCYFFLLSITSAYGINIGPSALTYKNKKYPIIALSKISIDLKNNKYNKIAIKFPHGIISKKIEKIIVFRDGFAFIKKKKKPLAAISCFDLALIFQYQRIDFTKKMQRKLREQNPQQGDILDRYLDKNKYSLKNLLYLAMQDSRILNFIDEDDLREHFIELCQRIVQGKLGGCTLFIALDRTYMQLLIDYSCHKNIGPFYRFASQLEILSALEFDKNWNEGGAIKYAQLSRLLESQLEVQYIMKALDEFLERVPKEILYLWWSRKHSSILQVLPREIMLYITKLYPQKMDPRFSRFNNSTKMLL
jgi:hypothetical protein